VLNKGSGQRLYWLTIKKPDAWNPLRNNQFNSSPQGMLCSHVIRFRSLHVIHLNDAVVIDKNQHFLMVTLSEILRFISEVKCKKYVVEKLEEDSSL